VKGVPVGRLHVANNELAKRTLTIKKQIITIKTKEYEVNDERAESLIPRRLAHSFMTATNGRTRKSSKLKDFYLF